MGGKLNNINFNPKSTVQLKFPIKSVLFVKYFT